MFCYIRIANIKLNNFKYSLTIIITYINLCSQVVNNLKNKIRTLVNLFFRQNKK